MMHRKQQIRARFRDATFAASRHRCIGCGRQHAPATADATLDAHHITPREEFPNGGYVQENGAPLCKLGDDSCHMKAEHWLKHGAGEPGYSPAELYAKIGSSRERALAADARLGRVAP